MKGLFVGLVYMVKDSGVEFLNSTAKIPSYDCWVYINIVDSQDKIYDPTVINIEANVSEDDTIVGAYSFNINQNVYGQVASVLDVDIDQVLAVYRDEAKTQLISKDEIITANITHLYIDLNY